MCSSARHCSRDNKRLGRRLKKGVSVAFTEDGGNLISIEYLGRDGDTIVGVSALLGREGAPVVSYECPDIVGSWFSGTYDSISADEAGKVRSNEHLFFFLLRNKHKKLSHEQTEGTSVATD